MLANGLHWLLMNWHWLVVIIAVALFTLTGFVLVMFDDDGDWWVL